MKTSQLECTSMTAHGLLPSLCATHMHCEISRLLWSPADFGEGPGQTSLDALTEVAEPHVYVARNKLQHCTDELNTFWLSLKNKGHHKISNSAKCFKCPRKKTQQKVIYLSGLDNFYLASTSLEKQTRSGAPTSSVHWRQICLCTRPDPTPLETQILVVDPQPTLRKQKWIVLKRHTLYIK